MINISIEFNYIKYNIASAQLENSFSPNYFESFIMEALGIIDYNSIFNFSYKNKNIDKFPYVTDQPSRTVNIIFCDNDEFCVNNIDIQNDCTAEFKIFSDFYDVIDLSNKINIFINTSFDFVSRYFSIMRNKTMFPEIDMYDVAFSLKLIENISLEILRSTEFIENSNGSSLKSMMDNYVFIPDIMYGLNCYDNVDNIFDQMMIEGKYPEEVHPHLIEISESRLEDKNTLIFSQKNKEIFRNLKSLQLFLKSPYFN